MSISISSHRSPNAGWALPHEPLTTINPRYLLELNAGYNGSESFAKGHRWGFFPSVSLGWNVGEEAFFEPIKKFVQQLKLRGSYGLVGNDQVEKPVLRTKLL